MFRRDGGQFQTPVVVGRKIRRLKPAPEIGLQCPIASFRPLAGARIKPFRPVSGVGQNRMLPRDFIRPILWNGGEKVKREAPIWHKRLPKPQNFFILPVI
jgi:hypothetical protein